MFIHAQVFQGIFKTIQHTTVHSLNNYILYHRQVEY